jgi:hypothetical protein
VRAASLLLAWIVPSAMAATIYVSPTGSGAKDGKSSASALAGPAAGIAVASPGDTILLAGGTYTLSATVKITASGTATAPINLFAENAYSKRALFDFRTQGYGSANQGIILQANWWHLKGIDVWGAGDNGMQITGGSSNSGGSNNIVEWCSFYENMDAGFQIVHGGANNLVLNCDSHWNYDSLTSGGNADGFSPKLTLGTGNTFRGCRSWGNSDDGYDGYLKETESSLPDDITTTIENCWAFNNGYYHGDPASPKNTSSMNGTGFKMGGSANANQRHNQVLHRCLAFGNSSGEQFDQNNNAGSMTLINCTAYGTGTNYYLNEAVLGTGKAITVENSISAGGGKANILSSATQATNTWSTGFSVSDADFQSVDTAGVRGPRQSDGSLPNIPFMHLAAASKLIDKGTKVAGITYNGTAPDLGAFETGTTALQPIGLSQARQVRHNGNVLQIDSRSPGAVRVSLLRQDGRQIRDLGNFELAPSGTEIRLGELPRGLSLCRAAFSDGTEREISLLSP